MLLRICLLTFIIWGQLAFGSDPASVGKSDLGTILNKTTLAPQDLEYIYFRIGDDQKDLFKETQVIWESPSAQNIPLLKARAGWLLSKVNDDEYQELDNGVLKETIDLIDKHKLPIPRNEMIYFQLMLGVKKKTMSFDQASKDLLSYARNIESPDAKVLAISSLTFEFLEQSIAAGEIAALLAEIRKIADYTHAGISITNVTSMYYISSILTKLGEAQASDKLNGKLREFCNTHKMRSICHDIFYENGRTSAKMSDTDNLNLAVAYYLKSQELGQELHDAQSMAESYFGLTAVYNKLKNYEEAIKYGKMAFKIYEKIGPRDWAASTLMHLSVAYLRINDKKSALDAAKKSLALCPPEYKMDLMTIYQQLSKVFLELQQYKEAHEYLQMYIDLERITRRDDIAKKYLALSMKLEEERSTKLKEHLQLEEEKNTLLQSQNELQARDLVLTNRLRIIAFVLFILLGVSGVLMILTVRRGRQVLHAKLKIQSILDNVDEGLMTIDGNMRITDGHSAYAQRLFPEASLAGKDVFDVILNRAEAAAEDRSLWHETLKACIGEDSIAWELNADHFPKEITIASPKKRILSLHWQPLIMNGTIQRFLLSVRDETSVKALEAEVIAERQRRQGLQNHITEILSNNFYEAKRLVVELGEALPQMPEQIVEASSRLELMRRLHTNKGVARSLGLQTLSRTIHELEDAAKGSESIDKAKKAIERLHTEQKSYAYVFEEVLPAPQGTESQHSLLDTVNALVPELNKRLHQSSLSIEGIDVNDHVMNWDKALLKDIRDIIMHSLANAVDHGFILPRGRGVDLQSPQFKITATRSGSGISLRIADNGAGLDWARLELIAKQKGFIPNPGQSLVDVLFLDGVSTAEKVSETSGRGVGLAAVRSICQQRQGDLKIGNNPDGPGTLLEMKLIA